MLSVLLLLAAGLGWMLGGTVPGRLAIGGPWSLTRGDGAPMTDRDLRGHYALLFFGYTRCPDLCPAALAAVADAMRRLGARADGVQPVFVTVDPAHDTPSVVRDYARRFDPRLIGLTGTTAEIDAVERDYRITARVETDGTVEHSAVLVLLGPDGRFVAPIPAEADGREIARRLAGLLS